MAAEIASVFAAVGDRKWTPAPIARGPFDGLQGGALAGLMCAEAEAALGPGFLPVAITAQYLKPCPLAEVTIELRIVQQGRRTAIVDAELWSEGALRARATTSFVAPVQIAGVPEAPIVPFDPEPLPRRQRRAPHGQPWLMDVMDSVLASDGTFWFRMRTPLTGAESPFARALAPIDWVVGISRPDSFDIPVVAACPNLDLTAHMERAPASDWIGVTPTGRWRKLGMGVAHGRIHDASGPCGDVTASVVLVPRSG